MVNTIEIAVQNAFLLNIKIDLTYYILFNNCYPWLPNNDSFVIIFDTTKIIKVLHTSLYY